MPKTHKIRSGSLQFWPHKRARKFLPSVNWSAIKEEGQKGLLGFIAYKVGMKSALVKDLTPDSLSKNKKIAIPVTILEVPSMRIFSVRFYKNNQVVYEVVVGEEKELKRKLKLPKEKKQIDFEKIKDKDYDDVKVIIYSQVKKTGIKKRPDLIEIGLAGNLEEKKTWTKEHIGKEILASFIFKKMQLTDVRGLTKGHGFSGPVKRFGIGLRQHKSEKGRRRPGSLGPWHPARVTFRVPMAGQYGMFTRINYNQKIIEIDKIQNKNINPASGFEHYGLIQGEYIILRGSVQGPQKRQLLLTMPLRKTKKQQKKNFEFIKVL